MPKLIDYVARFQEIRRAVYVVTLQDGPTAVTLGSVAAEMGLSVSSLGRLLHSADELPRLGLQWAEGVMREHLFSVPLREQRSGDPVTCAVRALLLTLPRTESLADAERVWRALVGAHERRAAWAHDARRDQAAAQEATCRRVVETLALPKEDQDHEVDRLRALVEGVIAGVCARTFGPETGVAVISRHLESLLGERPLLHSVSPRSDRPA